MATLGEAVNSVQNPAYQAGMEARFAVAARHSRMVRVLRVAVPAAVILSLTAIILVSIFNPFRMATNRGSFELKYFFTASIASADGGEAHSAEAVRHQIKRLIDAEDPALILSDDTIVERLRESGIDIARRTVAKYREAMRIPSSVQRRRDKQKIGRASCRERV